MYISHLRFLVCVCVLLIDGTKSAVSFRMGRIPCGVQPEHRAMGQRVESQFEVNDESVTLDLRARDQRC